jgi:regulatory protein
MSKLKSDLMKLLVRREYSVFELRQKMLAKNFPPQAIDFEIDQLKAQGLQSDQRFVFCMCEHYAKSGKGPQYVLMQLQLRGVEKSLALAGVSEYDWQESLMIARRKLASLVGQKLKHRLFARGFTDEAIKQGMIEEENG